MLGQQALSRSLFPLGELQKQQVREMAEKAGFPNHKKKDSTGICFIGERKFRDFLQRFLPAMPGAIEDPQGDTIGQHQGLMYYTLGQRQGLGIGGRKDAQEAPWFVAYKDLNRNVLVAVQGHQHPLLMSKELICSRLHWVEGRGPTEPFLCQARIRHRQPLQPCRIQPLESGLCQVFFNQPQRAATPGQSLVIYRDQVCLGGGIIESTDAPEPYY
jgi:tRNA-specific 2-thiouridylase